MKRTVLFTIITILSCLLFCSGSQVIAQDFCEGNFDYDKDVDGTDAATFKSDSGRSPFQNPCPDDGPAPVPKTGQNTVYFPRDDGDLEKGVEWPNPRFTDNSGGTVTDNLTGLIWLKDANCLGARTWQQALMDCQLLAHGQCDLTDGSSLGDWRLPNRFELESLLSLKYTGPAIPSGHPFTNVISAFYWSSTTTAIADDRAWGVNFNNGSTDYFLKSGVLTFVWPVRGGQ